MRLIFSIAIGVSSMLTVFSAQAQTLFTYGPNAVSKEEFLRVYQKNNAQKKPDFSAKSVNEYLDLYSLFRMKVKEAEQMRLDTTTAVRTELNNYKGQLARTYLSDKEVTKELVKQAYERMKEEVKVAHILIAVRPNDDTAKAYQKIDSIYNAIVSKKADFGEMAKQFSEDKSSAVKGGDIGYISALQVVYPFENAAYATAPGQVSKPFRTQFGYHLVKVEDKRKSKGQVQVAQIMIGSPKSKGEQGIADSRKKMDKIQAELKGGKKFEDLAKEYSDDKFSKDKGGLMEPFGVGKLMPEFENAAFALKSAGDVAQPIQTEYGLHLIKLVKKIPLESFENVQDNITRRVENDGRATVAKEAYQEKVKKQHGFKDYPENFAKVMAALPPADAKEKTFKADDYKPYTAPLFELSGKKYTQYDFMNYAEGLTRGSLLGNRETAMRDLYKMYQTTTLNDLQQEELEKNNADFRNLITEYRDGILLFDLMDKNVWSKASKDSVGLQEFYVAHKQKYQWQPGFEGTVYQSGSEVDLNKVKAELDKGGDVNEIMEKLTSDATPVQVSQQSGRFEFSRFPVDQSYFAEGKASKVFRNDDGTFSMVVANKLFKTAEERTLDEARGFAIADYQDYLEKKWNDELKAKYPVKVEEKTLKTIVK
ncbi:MAG: peptidylprolyl isomerase [Taibaiella sp.]|jgi:peptidyl-prolyl cis-trans isomerase SurA